MHVNQDRLSRELEQLATMSDAVPPAVTRILYTDADLRARALIKQLCLDAKLEVRVDQVGNFFARWIGAEASAAAVGTGSHIDAIPNSGRFDGTVGVLGGLEAIRALQLSGFRPRRSIELLLFTSEEPTRFGIGCLGSRALCGALSPDDLENLRDSAGHWFDHVRREAGFHGQLAKTRLSTDYFSSFVELHIEQGPMLERAGIPIGVVTAIAAPATLRITVDGIGGHAGAVLMPDRRDALCAAAEIVLVTESAAKSTGSADTVATAGTCLVSPGAVNGIPSHVALEIDVRDVRLESRDCALDAIRSAVAEIAQRRGVTIRIEILNSDPPATLSDEVIAAAEAACATLGVRHQRMVSRAYHDSLFMSRLCPTGMIFIPCRDGVSHRPDEYAKPEDICRGVEVLAQTLALLAS